MKKIPIICSLAVFALSCQKNDNPERKERFNAPEVLSNTTGTVCDDVIINVTTKTINVKGVTYTYPYNIINMTGFPSDAAGNSVLKTNCIDNSTATTWQKEMHHRNDSLFGIVSSVFSSLTQPQAPSYTPYTMLEFETAMDNTDWPAGSDGADYASTIFNGTIRKNPAVQKLPGISVALLGPALAQNKDFTEITLTQAINYTNHAEAFVLAVGLIGPGSPDVMVIDHRYFRHTCLECEPIEKISGRQGPGTGNASRLSSYFDYNTASSIRYFMYNGS